MFNSERNRTYAIAMFKAPTAAKNPPGRAAGTRVAQPTPQGIQRRSEASVSDLQRTIGNQAVLRILRGNAASSRASPPFRTNLAINEPGDRFEQEADRIAEQVIRAPASGPATPALAASVPGLQMKPAGPSTGAGQTVAPPIVHNVLRSPGRSLDAATRAFMEPRFGHDFSQVRVHTDSSAAASAKALRARAYTVGSNVAFAGNQFSPATTEGKRLLAHELAHVVQQSSGATAIQRAPDKDDEDETVVRPARARSCPGGAMPYNGVCLTDEVLEALPAVGDVHAAEKIVKANTAEKRAQARVAEKYAKLPNAALNKRIDQVREDVERSDQPGVIPASLRRLEKERDRRRALPISAPTGVDQAIAMLEEAWSLAEMEHPPDIRRASYLVHVVNNWLQEAALPSRYDEYFSGMSKTTAMTSVGMAKGNVDNLEHKFRLGGSIGGWWPATINSLKASRELVQIMSGEKRVEETEFNAISKTINKASVATPLIGAGVMAAPALVAAGFSVPALPATIQGVRTVVWGRTLMGAALSSSYLSHVVERSKEAAATEGGSNPISIVSAALVDTSGAGKVVEAATNKSVLTGEDLHRSNAERAVGAITGGVEFALNFWGAKDFLGDPVPQVKAPRRAATEPAPEPTPVGGAKTEQPASTAGQTTASSASIADEIALGPIKDFPFGGGRQPLPKPESPNKVYRIMGMDEAAQSMQTGKLSPPIRGAEGERFVSLDSDYTMLFREKEIAKIEVRFGKQVENVKDSLKSIDDRVAQLKAEPRPNQEAISKLTAQREKLLASHEQRGLANKAEAEPIIKEWHEAPGQQVVVEIELQQGTLDDMLTKSVDHAQGNWGNYSSSGKDVYLWKLERGYGRNIGIPKWQLDAFNAQIKAIRFYAHRGMKLLGEIKAPLGNN